MRAIRVPVQEGFITSARRFFEQRPTLHIYQASSKKQEGNFKQNKNISAKIDGVGVKFEEMEMEEKKTRFGFIY